MTTDTQARLKAIAEGILAIAESDEVQNSDKPDLLLALYLGIADKGEQETAANLIAHQYAEIARLSALTSRDEEDYLVWSNEHRAWWRPTSNGYTQNVLAAGLYSKEEALRISFRGRDGWYDPSEEPAEIAVPFSCIPEKYQAVIRALKVKQNG